jgi:FixJ family two-component response regulator
MKLCKICKESHSNTTTLCSICKEIKRKYDKTYYSKPEVRKKITERTDQWRKSNPDRVKQHRKTYYNRIKTLKELTEKEHEVYDRIIEVLFRVPNR